MQPLCRSHDWTVVNHYCTQNWVAPCVFLRQCCTHCLCPTLWSQCSKLAGVLAMQFLCRSHGWTVVNHYCKQNWVSPVFFAAMLHSLVCAPHCGHNASKNLARSWPCSLCAEVMIGLWVIIIAHKTGVSPCVFCGNAALTVCAPHLWSQCSKTGLGLGHAAFVQKSWLDCGKSLLHTKLGSHHVFFAAMLHSQFLPHIVATVPQNWLGYGHAALVQKS